MKEIFNQYPVGYVSLAILREYYLDYIRQTTEEGRYKGDINALIKVASLDQLLKEVDNGRKEES